MTPRNDPAYLLRFPDGMREALKAEAEAAHRTLAAHILYLLETHPERPKKRKAKR